MKITDLSILCKWENLKNWQCIKYLFAPIYIEWETKQNKTNKNTTGVLYCHVGMETHTRR